MNQSQREALLDLLLASIYTDSHLSLKEDEALQAALENLGWEAAKPREIFLCNSMNRARKVSESDAATADYIATRAAAFTDAESRKTALDHLERVFASDGTAPAETSFLARVRASFS